MNRYSAAAALAATVGLTLGAGSAFGQTVVWANNGSPGDSYTNASGTNSGQAVGSSGFYYNNVRNNGVVGINNTYARSGNGSVFFSGVDGGSKADFEMLPSATSNINGNWSSGAGSSLGRLGDLTSLKYDWYRDSSSTNPAGQHPVIRLLVETASGDRGGLVFELAYNGTASVPTDTWVSEDILSYNGGNGANMWTFGAGMGFAQEGYGNSLASWAGGVGTIDGDTKIIGVSFGVGSGWNGLFEGAIDNLVLGFNGVETAYNFETVVIPLPSGAGLALAGIGLIGLRRRR